MPEYEPELGQMFFGTAWHEIECPQFVEDGLSRLSDEIESYWNRIERQHWGSPMDNSGDAFSTDKFKANAYYWGDCECGWDEMEFSEPHDEHCYQIELAKERDRRGLHDCGFGNAAEDAMYNELTKKYGLPYVGCAVHCTCSHKTRFREWLQKNAMGPEGHRPDCPIVQPNFKCGDFEVRWYKYLGRGMSMNREISEAEFQSMLADCIKSISELDTPEDKETNGIV